MSNQQNIVALNKLCLLANKSEKRVIRCRKCNNEEKKLPQKGVYMYVDITSNKTPTLLYEYGYAFVWIRTNMIIWAFGLLVQQINSLYE